jgi:hypothetical protein
MALAAQTDSIIDTLVTIKHQLYTERISHGEFDHVRDKLLDARELIRSIVDMLNKKTLTNDDYAEKRLEHVVHTQNSGAYSTASFNHYTDKEIEHITREQHVRLHNGV